MATPPDAAAGLSTPEYLAFRKCYTSVMTHISPQTGDICGALFEKGYIPTAVRFYATTDGIPNDKKAQTLVDTVIDKVGVDPSVFHGFMSILKSEGPWADSIVEQLEEAFKAEQALADCGYSSEDSFHSLPDPDSTTGGTVKEPEPQNMGFNKRMDCSGLCKWLVQCRLPKNVISIIREQDIDGDSFLQLSSLSREDLSKELDCKLTFGAHNKLRNALNQAEASEQQGKSATSDFKFICPFCKKCTVMQFFSEAGCPKAPQHNSTEGVSLFPYLDDSALTRDEKIMLESRLMDDTRQMILLFAKTEDSFIVSFDAKDIDIPRLRNFAGNIVSKVGTEEQVEKLNQSSKISEVFDALQPFKSFFHYEIIEDIVRMFGSPSDNQLMDEYISKFNEFCERSVFQVPPNIFHDRDLNSGDKIFSIKLTKEGQASLIDVVAVRKRMANILDIKVFALQLCCITEGCVCLSFLIASHVAEKIFPLSQSQVGALRDIHVTVAEGPSPAKNKDVSTGEEKFKTQLAAAVPASAASAHPEQQQQTEEFIDACKEGDIDKLINVCLESLGIEGEAATELRAVALEEVFEGDISFISHLVRESGINLDERDAKVGGTALFWSSYNGHTKIVEMLIECGASLNVQTKDGSTALEEASFNGHHKVVDLLINAGAAVDVQDEEGYTALHSACQEGHDDTVKILMRAKADLNLQTNEGVTALYLASQNGYVTTVQLLVEAGASLDVQSNDGSTALEEASFNGHHKVVDLLINAGAAVDVQDEEGATALYLASQNGYVTTVQLLVEAGASLDVQTNDGRTPLYQASGNGHHKVVDLLTNAGATVDVQNEMGHSAFHVACQEGHDEAVKILMRAKADLHQKTKRGFTALHLASQDGHVTTVQLLVEAGASLDAQTNEGHSAFHVACQGGHDEAVKILMRAKADLNLKTKDGFTALHLASSDGHMTTVQLLVEAGASLDMQTNDGRTALYQASVDGHHKVVDLLTNAGAAVDVQAEMGHSAFHVACQGGHDEPVKILMRAKADLNLKTKEGATALHLASQDGHVTTVQLLVKAGASLDAQTNDGRTALDVATQFQGADSAVVQTLTKAGVKSGKQLSDSSATHLTSEKSPQQLKPSSGVGHQALVKTDGQAPKPLQQLKSSGSVQHNKPPGMSLIKLVKTGRSFVTSKLRDPKKIKGDHSNLQKSNRRSKEKTV